MTYGAGLCVEKSWVLFLLIFVVLQHDLLLHSFLLPSSRMGSRADGHRSSPVALGKKKATLRILGLRPPPPAVSSSSQVP